jgi:hypothetical protein
MNTPAHIAASVLVWRNEVSWGAASAVTIGALLPDLPMFGFYAYQRLIAGRSERDIWSELYFQDSWQLLFDVFNSVPLMLTVVVVSYFCRIGWGVLIGASALLHLCLDFPLRVRHAGPLFFRNHFRARHVDVTNLGCCFRRAARSGATLMDPHAQAEVRLLDVRRPARQTGYLLC